MVRNYAFVCLFQEVFVVKYKRLKCRESDLIGFPDKPYLKEQKKLIMASKKLFSEAWEKFTWRETNLCGVGKQIGNNLPLKTTPGVPETVIGTSLDSGDSLQ